MLLFDRTYGEEDFSPRTDASSHDELKSKCLTVPSPWQPIMPVDA